MVLFRHGTCLSDRKSTCFMAQSSDLLLYFFVKMKTIIMFNIKDLCCSKCRTCWTPGGSNGSYNLQGHYSLEYIPSYVAHKEAALVWKASNKIIPEFAKVNYV